MAVPSSIRMGFRASGGSLALLFSALSMGGCGGSRETAPPAPAGSRHFDVSIAAPTDRAIVAIGEPIASEATVSVSGTAAWGINESSVDTVELQIKHARTQSITDSTSVGVVKPPAPPTPTTGTWNTIGAYPPLTASQATGHRSTDFYFIMAIGYNASVGPFNPSAEDFVEITMN
jgi:hypothetical protein